MSHFYSASYHDANDMALDLGEALQGKRNPFQQQIVVVQSQGMGKWLKLRIADQCGICGAIKFSFPKAFITKVLSDCGLLGQQEAFSRENMTWNLYQKWPQIIEGHDVLKNYVFDQKTASINKEKAFALAEKVAALFDHYLVYRPHWFEAWEARECVQQHFPQRGSMESLDPKTEAWQMDAWNVLDLDASNNFTGALEAFCHDPEEALQNAAARRGASTMSAAPLHVAGISSLPPLYLKFFGALSKCRPVHMFRVVPCLEDWSETRRRAKTAKGAAIKGEAEALDHPLLASWGTLGRDFLDEIINNQEDLQDGDVPKPPKAKANTCLEELQRGLLFDRPQCPTKKDTSLQIHSCHSPKREVEVLQDVIYHHLERGLKPGEILVMSADLDAHQPFIESVFGHPGLGMPRLPFSIADRNPKRFNPCYDWLQQLFSLPKRRLKAGEVMAWLGHPVIMQQFRLQNEDLPILRSLLERSDFRWGYDREHRVGLELPAFEQNSWSFSLKRLLMGLCFEDEASYGQIAPVPLEDQERQLLGIAIEILDALWQTRQELGQSKDKQAWNLWFSAIESTYFSRWRDEDDEKGHLQKAMSSLQHHLDLNAVEGSLPPSLIQKALLTHLESEEGTAGFLQGGITFCRTLPMRALPFKMIAILGLNDHAFPRRQRPMSFDLMAASPQKCDRSLVLDDRYLFLETVMAAKEVLHLSYVGQSIKDGSESPPSIVLGELMDFFRDEQGKGKLSPLRHRLQGYSKAYFQEGSPLRSRSRPNAKAAQALAQKNTEPERFQPFTSPQQGPPADLEVGDTVSISELIAFLQNPARFFLKRRWNVDVYDESKETMDDSEPMGLPAGLDRYKAHAFILNWELSGAGGDGLGELERQGKTPLNPILKQKCELDVQSTVALAEEVQRRTTSSPRELDIDQQFQVQGRSIRLQEQLTTVHDDTILLTKPGALKDKDKLRALVNALVLVSHDPKLQCCLIGEGQKGLEAEVFTLGAQGEDLAVEQRLAKEDLQNILEHWLRAHWQALPFFPATSLASTMSKSKSAWMGYAQRNIKGEREDPSFKLCFGQDWPGDHPLVAAAFNEMAKTYGDMIRRWEVSS